jgi:hypothetical protein
LGETPPSPGQESNRVIKIEEHVHRWQIPTASAPLEAQAVIGRDEYSRLIVDDILFGSQLKRHDRNICDDFQLLTAAHPLENIAVLGAVQAFDLRQEPLTYYHRTGPVGAIFAELGTRKNGTDAKARFAKLGLETGAVLCYARPGQSVTIYESNLELKQLVADTDQHFTHVRDARTRGAEIEIRIGDRRKGLGEDKDRKFTLILVEAYEGRTLLSELFTKEAVRLYFDRMTDDGLLALHISSRDLNLEPVLARIAEELNLTGRVWSDDAATLPGKCNSTWLVLARTPQALGGLGEQKGYGIHFRPIESQASVPAWTDANTEVVAGMKIPSVKEDSSQKFRVVKEPVEEKTFRMTDKTKVVSDVIIKDGEITEINQKKNKVVTIKDGEITEIKLKKKKKDE